MTTTELVQKAIEIGTSASGFPLTLSEDERKALFALSLEWGGKRILGAWKLYQDDPGKRGKPFRFFQEDYPRFLPRIGDSPLEDRPSIFTECGICGSQYQTTHGRCPYCEEHPDLVRREYIERDNGYPRRTTA